MNLKTGKKKVLYSFTGVADGFRPSAGLITDGNGNLYGTTEGGGVFALGVVYKLIIATRQETVLYNFTGQADGSHPSAGVIRDASGNLYSTANGGFSGGAGTIFKLDTTGNLTTLYTFTGGSDGASPIGGLVRDSKGNLYGATYAGGLYNGSAAFGTIFEITP